MSSSAQGVPVAAKHPVVDTYAGGVRVTDDYRWLENGTSAETTAWVKAENEHTNAVLDGLPQRERVLAWLKQLRSDRQPTYAAFQVRQGRLFALRRNPKDPASKLVTFDSPEDKSSERQILDLGKLEAGKLFQADWFSVSPDGRLVSMALSEGGSEDASLHTFDTTSGRPTDSVLPHVQFATAGGSMAWKADGSGFFYTRYPRGTERPPEDADFFQQLYFHKLGTPTETDGYVLGRELPKIAEIELTRSPDGSQILVTVENGDGGDYAIYVIGGDGRIHPVAGFDDKVKSASFGVDNSLWLLSQKSSPHGDYRRLASAESPLATAKVVIPATDTNFERDAAFVSKDRLYATVIDGGPEEIRVYTLEGKRLPDLRIPRVASVGGMIPDGAGGFLFGVQTYTTPWQWYRESGTAEPVALPFGIVTKASLADIDAERVFATSKDGTKIPMTVLSKKGLVHDGKRPTILYGYGGYGVNLAPWFDPRLRQFYDAGGVYAIANLRGGAEYGEAWHTAGSLLNKQNVFDDFSACAGYLVKAGYTSREHLAAEGGSNGGLLMGAMLTQHPEQFRAVLSEVGIYDMLRVELDPNGQFNTTEFGSTKDATQFRALQAYSPYHHVRKGVAYPATLFVTGDNDHRVSPSHSRKMIAEMQADTGGTAPILLLTNAHAGHGVSTDVNEADLETADTLAFLYSETGVSLQ